MQRHYDLLVIGSGPSGQRAAVQAAKLGKSVAVIERKRVIGGNAVHTGTIPSKTLRETVLNLSGWRERGFYGKAYRVKKDITVDDLKRRLEMTLQHEIEVMQHQLMRNGVEVISGQAHFVDPNTVRVTESADAEAIDCTADYIVLAVGTRPHRPPNIPFDGRKIMDSDQILKMQKLPRTMARRHGERGAQVVARPFGLEADRPGRVRPGLHGGQLDEDFGARVRIPRVQKRRLLRRAVHPLIPALVHRAPHGVRVFLLDGGPRSGQRKAPLVPPLARAGYARLKRHRLRRLHAPLELQLALAQLHVQRGITADEVAIRAIRFKRGIARPKPCLHVGGRRAVVKPSNLQRLIHTGDRWRVGQLRQSETAVGSYSWKRSGISSGTRQK